MHGSHAHFNSAKDAKKPITIIYIIIPIIITIIQNDRHPSHHDHHHHHHHHQNHHHHHSEWLSSNIIIMHYIIIIMSRTLYALLGAKEMTEQHPSEIGTAPLCFQFCRLPINSNKATAFLPQWTYFHAGLTGQSVLSERVLVPPHECPKAPARVKTV